MKRREFITLLCSAAAWPLRASAQQPAKRARVGLLIGTSPDDAEFKSRRAAFERALARLGWTDGLNIELAYRWVESGTERFRAAAAELLELEPDVIVIAGTQSAIAVLAATRTIPVVFVTVADPVAQGFVASLAHPGGNATGFTNFEFSLGGKWLETLKEMAPHIKSVGVLVNPTNPTIPLFLKQIHSAAVSLNLETIMAPATNGHEIESAIVKGVGPGGGLVVLPDNLTVAHRKEIAGVAAKHRVPAIYPFREFVQTGGLMSLGIDVADQCRQAAEYVERILKGVRPADLPVQAPNRFELLINSKTAKALGLEIPPTLLARADEVIE
ncbi:MAG: ABC transporter substrate-binding protein [Xanthobacteraceae bacterium]